MEIVVRNTKCFRFEGIQTNSFKEGHFASLFFSSDVSYAVKETEKRESRGKFLKISSVPIENEIYTTLSQ
jgi:hypothetical protein